MSEYAWIRVIRMHREQHAEMMKLQQWLCDAPAWWDMGDRVFEQVSEVEQDALEKSDCPPDGLLGFVSFDLRPSDDGPDRLMAIFDDDSAIPVEVAQ